jgi:hypothetical protein
MLLIFVTDVFILCSLCCTWYVWHLCVPCFENCNRYYLWYNMVLRSGASTLTHCSYRSVSCPQSFCYVLVSVCSVIGLYLRCPFTEESLLTRVISLYFRIYFDLSSLALRIVTGIIFGITWFWGMSNHKGLFCIWFSIINPDSSKEILFSIMNVDYESQWIFNYECWLLQSKEIFK